MKKALIVGAAGQDGRLLGKLLLSKGYEVYGLTRTPPGIDLAWKCYQVNLLDYSSVGSLLACVLPDEIYYLAAFHHSSEHKLSITSMELLQKSFEIHQHGLVNFLQAIRSYCPAARLFYAASSYVFGDVTAQPQDENTPFQPTCAYGISKAAGVACCRFYRRHESVYASLGILYNHESPLRKAGFLSQKIIQGVLQARRDPSFKLALGDLSARVDWGYAPDYVEAMFRILQLPVADDFVIATGENHTVQEFVELAFGYVGLEWERHVRVDPAIVQKQRYTLRGNASKLRAATGWSPSLTFSEMILELLRQQGTFNDAT
jgi:GDPmannose 4,6-dehydratase